MPDAGTELSPRRWALMGDVPAILDGMWRRLEFNIFRPGRYQLNAARQNGAPIDYRFSKPGWSMVWLLYALLTVFIVTGPTVSTLCGLGGAPVFNVATCMLVPLCCAISVYLFWRYYHAIGDRIGWRIESCPLRFGPSFTVVAAADAAKPANAIRRRWALVALYGIGALVSSPALILAVGLLRSSSRPPQCTSGPGWSIATLLQLLLILVINVAAWWVLYAERRSDRPIKRPVAASFRCFIWLVGLWVLGVAVLWVMAPEHAVEANVGPYRHTSWIWIGALMAVAALAYPTAAWRLARLPAQFVPGGRDGTVVPVTAFKDAKTDAPLLAILGDDQPPPPGRAFSAFITALGLQPLHTLLLPAFFAISLPREYLLGTLPVLAFAMALATYGLLRTRWRQVVMGIQRWFFVGLPLPLSAIVIVLAALRLFKEQYVATILDAAPLGTIFTSLIVCYLSAWFFEVWINRWMAEALLRRLGANPTEATLGRYEFTGQAPQPNGEWTVASQRAFYVHGPGRIGVQGWQERPTHDRPGPRSPTVILGQTNESAVDREERFSYFSFAELFEVMCKTTEADQNFMDELRRQLRVYFYTINLTVVGVAAALVWWHLRSADPLHTQPMFEAAAPSPTGVNLAARLSGGSEPALIIAASGGGTRAALYTAYALSGLNDLGQTRNIALISGVSGGGAAAAAFVERYELLTATRAAASPMNAWRQYEEAVASPFIADVLDGMDELRIAGPVSLGQLLAESMQRRLFAAHSTFESITRADRPALILNSTISGHPIEDATLLDGRAAWDGTDGCTGVSLPFGSLAGGRLVYTNLGSELFATAATRARSEGADKSDVPGEGLPDVRLDFHVVNDPAVPLAVASALNANFPPVFPNARVDIRSSPAAVTKCAAVPRTYYVTDGGATENLGLISALVVLKNTLRMMGNEGWAQLRPLHLVAIEASALDYEYSQDRGVGAATGGSKERIAGGLTRDLIDEVNVMLSAHNRKPLMLHYLSMPMAFRSRGGIGTHWMYAERYTVSNPLRQTIPRWYQFWESCGDSACDKIVDHDDIRDLWSSLFDSKGGFCQRALRSVDGRHPVTAAAITVRGWMCGDERATGDAPLITAAGRQPDWLIDAWQQVVQSFGGNR